MELNKKILQEYKEAMINKEEIKKWVLNYLISQMKYKEIELGRELDEADIIGVIRKEIKSREESLEYLRKAGKIEDIDIEIKSIEILKTYLPQEMTETDLRQLIQKKIWFLGIQDLKKERGRLIASIMNEYKTVVDPKMMNDIINSMI